MRVAVIGGTGFVGRALVTELIRRGDVDVVVTSRSGTVSHPEAEVVALTSGDSPVEAFQRLGRPSSIVYLAWTGLPNYLDLQHYHQVGQHYDLISGLVEQGVRSVTVAGTCFEYGMQAGELAEDTPTAPTNPYGFGKTVLHRQLRFLQETSHFGLTWARLFYMYGEGQSDRSIYSLFHAAVARGDVTFPMSKGEQLRDFLHVDVVGRILAILAVEHAGSGTVNVCSGVPTSVRGLVEGWRAASASQIELHLGAFPYPSYEPLAFWGSAAKLHRLIPGLRMGS